MSFVNGIDIKNGFQFVIKMNEFPLSIFDIKIASPSEQAILMCIERMDELEKKLQIAEKSQCDNKRASCIHIIASSCTSNFSVYIDLMCFSLGENPKDYCEKRKQCETLKNIVTMCAAACNNNAALQRAEQLHFSCFGFGTKEPHPPPYWSSEFQPPVVLQKWNFPNPMNTIAMLKLLTAAELENFCEWKLMCANWEGY